MRARALALVGLSLAGCTHPPAPHTPVYQKFYHCGLSEAAGTLTLHADTDGVGWDDTADGIRFSANLSFLTPAEKEQFQRTGFHEFHFDHPIVFFEYPDDLKPDLAGNATLAGRPLAEVFGGARVGEGFIGRAVSVNVPLTLTWRQIETLLHGEGDMDVLLYDRSGTILRRAHLPRSYFTDIEKSLQALHARVLAREADRDRLCESEVIDVAEDEDDLIISD